MVLRVSLLLENGAQRFDLGEVSTCMEVDPDLKIIRKQCVSCLFPSQQRDNELAKIKSLGTQN